MSKNLTDGTSQNGSGANPIPMNSVEDVAEHLPCPPNEGASLGVKPPTNPREQKMLESSSNKRDFIKNMPD